jgi:hypothetical protein
MVPTAIPRDQAAAGRKSVRREGFTVYPPAKVLQYIKDRCGGSSRGKGKVATELMERGMAPTVTLSHNLLRRLEDYCDVARRSPMPGTSALTPRPAVHEVAESLLSAALPTSERLANRDRCLWLPGKVVDDVETFLAEFGLGSTNFEQMIATLLAHGLVRVRQEYDRAQTDLPLEDHAARVLPSPEISRGQA